MDNNTIELGITFLSQRDNDIQSAVKIVGVPAPRVSDKGFVTFVSTIISQQLSTKVANTIFKRFATLAGEITPARISSLSEQEMRDVGLSRRKIEYIQGLAQEVISGRFDIDALESMTNEDAIAAITKLRGFGRWSAEIYLLFSLGRLDVFPADDLGILLGLQKLKGLETKPTPAKARKMIEHWSPWQSVGALFLWHYYHSLTTELKDKK
ncbi:DNA-3-methyladenine glycosylase 2 family protein [Vibrio viridaestus]|uniref:DNA-3-methyladenine glycosylase II n=1 Tax=Vibrio viridaestus TaxID=2487322 RepID=A0A3N9TJI7_9VIBR|nr:DNA-3-methyladenine glycosylase 2 family protein [Vibrio viridaestus]